MAFLSELCNRHNGYRQVSTTDTESELREVVIHEEKSSQDQRIQNYVFKEGSRIPDCIQLEIVSYLSLEDRHSYMSTSKSNAIIGGLFEKSLLLSAFPEHTNLIRLLYSEDRENASNISFSSRLRRVSKIIEKQSVSSRFRVTQPREFVDWKRMSLQVFRKTESALYFLQKRDQNLVDFFRTLFPDRAEEIKERMEQNLPKTALDLRKELEFTDLSLEQYRNWRRPYGSLQGNTQREIFPPEILFCRLSFEAFEEVLQDFYRLFLRENSFHEDFDPEIEETITALVNRGILGHIISCSPTLSNELSSIFKKFLKIAVLRNNLDISQKLFNLISSWLSFGEIGQLAHFSSRNEDLSGIFQNYVTNHPRKNVLNLMNYKFGKISASLGLRHNDLIILMSIIFMTVTAFGVRMIREIEDKN